MNPRPKNIILLFAILAFSVSFSQSAFVENKGQWPEQVEFKMASTLHQVYFEKDAFTFNFVDAEALFGSSVHHGHQHLSRKDSERAKAHAYQMQFVDANKLVEVEGRSKQVAYENYFIGSDPQKWASEVRRFGEVYYKELYSSIDMKVHWSEQGFKYDFIVKPGASVDEIQMQFIGVDRFVLADGNLKIITSVGKIIEQKPYVYQFIKGKLVEIEAEYVLENKILSYRLLDDYDDKYDLIIDPELIFSTYSGSTTDNWGFTACSDKLGNVYSGGIIFNTGYPATLGAYQYDFAGGVPAVGPGFNYPNVFGSDITISKYNPDGTTLLWATYLGGSVSEEMPHSLVVNELNELIVFGITGSSDYPVSTNAYDTSFNGGDSIRYDGAVIFSSGTDIITSKLSSDGTQLTGSTFIGGSGNDGINWRIYYGANDQTVMAGNDSLYYNYADGARGEVIVDGKSDIFVGTTTFSSDFPTQNGFQLNSNGQQEGVVFKLSADLSELRWSSYLGGSHDDAIYSLEINSAGETYVAGGTVSQNFPTTTNAYQTTYQGGTTDGFVAHISNTGDQLLASTYFGSDAYDQAYFVRRDKFNNVFITGQTEASGSTFVHNAIYNTPNSGQFIAKFLPGLQILDWSTVFGSGKGRPNISISAFSVDICNRIYLSGWGRDWSGYTSNWSLPDFGTKGMEVTSDAVQTFTDGQDFYIMVMYGDASALDYATFYGEQYTGSGYCGRDHVDGGTSRFDRMGNIYQSVCASCGYTGMGESCNEFPTTTGAYSENSGGMNSNDWVCNNAVFRFSFAEDITVADFYAEPRYCENEIVNFTNTGISSNYYWDFGDGSPVVTDENPSHLFPGPGVYDVTLWTIDSNTCNITDTIVRSVIIQDQVSTQMSELSICLGEEVQIGPASQSNNSYSWSPVLGLSNPNIANPIASPNVTTDYTLLIDDGICLDTVWQSIQVLDIQYQILALSDTIICLGDDVQLSVQSTAPVSEIIWSTNPNFTNVINPGGQADILVSPTTTTSYYVMTRDSVCQLEALDTATVEIDIPQIEIDGPSTVCLGQAAQFDVQLLNGTTSSVHWEPAAIITSGQGTSSVQVQTDVPVWLSVALENSRGCLVKDSVYLQVSEIDASFTKVDLLCNGVCTGEIAVSYSGIAPFVLNWESGQSSDQLYNLCAGNYKLTITDSIACIDSLSIDITEPPLLQTQITDFQNTGCNELWNSGYATVDVIGGTPPYTYSWSNGDATATADSLYVGVFQVTVTDFNACSSIHTISITDPSPLEIALSSSPISCNNACDGASSVEIVIESTSSYTYIWNTGANTPDISSLCEGSYQVTVSDLNLCRRIALVSILNPEPINTEVTVSHQACYGDLADVYATVSGGTPVYNFEWSNGQTSNPALDLSDGSYTLIITDQHDCKDTVDFLIQSPEPIVIDTSSTLVNCELACNGIANISASGGQMPYQYLWSNGDNDFFADSLCAGLQTLSFTDANGCHLSIAFNIGINPDGVPIKASANPQTIYSGGASHLQATEDPSYHYLWLPELALSQTKISNPVARPFSTTIYQVNVEDSFGCKNSDTTIVYVKDVICEEPYIFVPNAFSPNDDGNNDILYVRGEMIEELQFSLYNRWGELVFETNHVGKGWDGVYNGKKVDPAVFVYHLKATCVNKDTFEKKGNITVVK